MFGYNNEISPNQQPNYPETTTPVYYGEEVVSAYWNIADTSQPVTATQIASFHGQYDATTGIATAPIFAWYTKGSSSHTTVIRDATDTGQMLFPTTQSGTPASVTFT